MLVDKEGVADLQVLTRGVEELAAVLKYGDGIARITVVFVGVLCKVGYRGRGLADGDRAARVLIYLPPLIQLEHILACISAMIRLLVGIKHLQLLLEVGLEHLDLQLDFVFLQVFPLHLLTFLVYIAKFAHVVFQLSQLIIDLLGSLGVLCFDRMIPFVTAHVSGWVERFKVVGSQDGIDLAPRSHIDGLQLRVGRLIQIQIQFLYLHLDVQAPLETHAFAIRLQLLLAH